MARPITGGDHPQTTTSHSERVFDADASTAGSSPLPHTKSAEHAPSRANLLLAATGGINNPAANHPEIGGRVASAGSSSAAANSVGSNPRQRSITAKITYAASECAANVKNATVVRKSMRAFGANSPKGMSRSGSTEPFKHGSGRRSSLKAANVKTLLKRIDDGHAKQSQEVADHRPQAAAIHAFFQKPHTPAGPHDTSVLDCVQEMLLGIEVVDLIKPSRHLKFRSQSKGKRGPPRIWLETDLVTLKHRYPMDGRYCSKSTNLAHVRSLALDTTSHKSRGFILLGRAHRSRNIRIQFQSHLHARIWFTGLSRLIPIEAKVRESLKAPPMERTNYDPLEDSFRGRTINSRRIVNQYIFLGVLGKGSFGEVSLALSTVDHEFYAVKVVKRKPTDRFEERWFREKLAILKRLDHPNIVQHRDILFDESHVIYVIEYLSGGAIQDCEKLDGATPLPESRIHEVATDAVKALVYLHAQRVSHNDIKPDNLLRSGSAHVKLADLGEAVMWRGAFGETSVNDGRPSSALLAPKGTPAFSPPEVCALEQSIMFSMDIKEVMGYAGDVYSLGASLFYMAYGRVPFQASSMYKMFSLIGECNLSFPEKPSISDGLKNLITSMMDKTPSERPSARQVSQHEWLSIPSAELDLFKSIYPLAQDDVEESADYACWKFPHAYTPDDDHQLLRPAGFKALSL